MSIAFDRRGTQVIWMGHTISVHWHREWANTLKDTQLTIVTHQGRVGPGMYANRRNPEELSVEAIDFNVDPARLPFWGTRNVPRRRFSSRTLADDIVQRVLKLREPD